MKLKENIIEILKKQWISYTQLVYITGYGSAPRELRYIRKNLPDGYFMAERPKDCGTRCKEFRLIKENENG